jgi:hypothetical protein
MASITHHPSSRHLRLSSRAGLCSVVLLAVGLLTYYSLTSPGTLTVIVDPQTLNLGTLSPGLTTSSVMVRNLSARNIVLRWHSSCECVMLRPPLLELAPREARTAAVHVHVDEEVSGELGVLVVGHTSTATESANFTVCFAAAPDNASNVDLREEPVR